MLGARACTISLLGINFDLYYELKYFKAAAGSFQNNINHFGAERERERELKLGAAIFFSVRQRGC